VITLRQSKAKVVAWDWLSPFGLDLLNPWSIIARGPTGIPRDDDVDVLVSIQAVWIDKQQNVHVAEIARQQISRRTVKLEGSNAKPDLKNSCVGPAPTPEDEKNIFENLYPSVPRSPLAGTEYGTGNFIVTILVTEDDEFGVRVRELASRLEAQRQGLIESITGALQ